MRTIATGTLAFTDPGRIFLDGKNVLGLVVEVDCARVLGDVALVGVVAETLTRGKLSVRFERVGRPSAVRRWPHATLREEVPLPMSDASEAPVRTAAPAAAAETGSRPVTADLDAAKLIADFARRTYAAEHDRTAALDAKAGVLLGATSAALALMAGTVNRPPEVLVQLPRGGPLSLLTLYVVAVVTAAALLVVADVLFARASLVRPFTPPDLAPWVSRDAFGRPPVELYLALAATYHASVGTCAAINAAKFSSQRYGVWFLGAGIITLVGGGVMLVGLVSLTA